MYHYVVLKCDWDHWVMVQGVYLSESIALQVGRTANLVEGHYQHWVEQWEGDRQIKRWHWDEDESNWKFYDNLVGEFVYVRSP